MSKILNKNFINYSLHKKLLDSSQRNLNDPIIKTMCRSSVITSDFSQYRIKVHNGKEYQSLTIKDNMIGHKLGEFCFTRARFKFKKKKQKKKKR